ncbi:cytochrome-c peroxidase [Aestuariibacter sp. AA17]|uniref:Cytochrome-c peroxidase n=1 Tax=Fluctibacter corallii TaxID=2984329 RepID=A0ABT3A5X2_9ALTE|nr:cytochrome c peroxidase [Aestuariibacter sp. AA17]MCV2884088.1 cytochrome-c peroxidase [Aestuariibacter sp. AA17]
MINKRLNVLFIVSFNLVCLATSLTTLASTEALDTFFLSKQCPPSFEKREGHCYLVSMYQWYDSVQSRGVGGTQTSLPQHYGGYTPEQISLGRYLFFDPILSGDNQLSCASCHQPDKGFSDGRDVSIGIHGQRTSRSAPSLWNVGFLDKLFWDGRASDLQTQAAGPLFADNEMGAEPTQLLTKLTQNSTYMRLFNTAFPSNKEKHSIELQQIFTALAAFQSSLISLNSRYDHYAHGYHDALSEDEVQGLNVFRSFVARCAECHQPPLFTNNQIAVIGVPEKAGHAFDPGAERVYKSKKLRGGFKVPTLRNITQTAPYMHAGNIEGLEDAVAFYNKGRGHAVPDNESLQLHWHIWEPNLTDREIELITAFLGALKDESLTPSIPTKVPSGLSVTAAMQPIESTVVHADTQN